MKSKYAELVLASSLVLLGTNQVLVMLWILIDNSKCQLNSVLNSRILLMSSLHWWFLAEANCISRWHYKVSFSVQIRCLLLIIILYMTVLSGMTSKWLRFSHISFTYVLELSKDTTIVELHPQISVTRCLLLALH